MGSVDGHALGTDESLGLAFGVDADEGRGNFMKMAVVGLNEILEGSREGVNLRHSRK